MLCVIKRSAMGRAMAISPSKSRAMGCAMGGAMAAVPCSIERHSTLCYGLTSHACYAWVGRGRGTGIL